MTPDSERCLLTATPACRSRAGITKISEGYVAEAEARPRDEATPEALSAEDQEMIEHALSGTTGVGKVAPARLKER